MHVYLRKIPEIGQMAEFTCTFVCLLLILVKILKKTCIFALDQDKEAAGHHLPCSLPQIGGGCMGCIAEQNNLCRGDLAISRL